MTLASNESESFAPNDLYGGEADSVTTSGTVASGNTVAKMEVLGRVTSSGEYAPFDPAATDGTEDAVALAAQDIDASGGATDGPLFVGGYFNLANVTAPNATAAQLAQAFDGNPIYLRDVKYSGA